MAIPPNAKSIGQPLDPADVLDFEATLSQGAADSTPTPFLLDDENVAGFELVLTSEAMAAGLEIRSGSGYPAPVIVGTVLTFWLGVEPALQGSTAFNGSGVTVGIELTATTTSNPPRVKQRTFTVQVANQ